MAQVHVKKAFGKKLLIVLAGHDHRVGGIECVVALPKNARNWSSDIGMRRMALARASELVEEFRQALEKSTTHCLYPVNGPRPDWLPGYSGGKVRLNPVSDQEN